MAFRGLSARSELQAARGSLTAARTALLDNDLPAAQADIDQAGRRTARASGFARDPVVRIASHLPLLGPSLQVARQLALGADELARQVLPDALATARQLDPRELRQPDGSINVDRLQQATPELQWLSARAGALDDRTRALPSRHVLAAVQRGRTEFARELSQLASTLQSASRAVALAPALLGADRPRRYFVLIQQTSESRGTGGLPGGFAVLEASRGRLRVTTQGTDADLVNGRIPPPAGVPKDYIDLYTPQGAFNLWQNVNVSPNLPVVARVVAARWKRQSGQSVDGVVALDAIALADILRGSGQVDIGGGQRIAPDKLPDFLAIGQYVGIPAISTQHRVRKERLTAVARVATARVTTGGGSSKDLLRGLIDAVRSGHLRMASDDRALAGLHAAGVDGALPDGPAPLAYPVIASATGGKLDYFLDRSVRYERGPCTAGRRGSEVTIDVTNRAPATGLPPYLTILINQQGQHDTTDSAIVLSLYGTRGSRLLLASLDGQPLPIGHAETGPYLSSGSDDGVPVWYLYLELPREKTQRLVLDLDEPNVAGAARIPVQPMARPLQVTSTGPICS